MHFPARAKNASCDRSSASESPPTVRPGGVAKNRMDHRFAPDSRCHQDIALPQKSIGPLTLRDSVIP
jgi:hypothetical protein